VQRINNALTALPEQAARLRKELEELRKERETERAELHIPFAQAEELREKKERARTLASELSLDQDDGVTDFSEDDAVRRKEDAAERRTQERTR
jgi:hypothetical protein